MQGKGAPVVFVCDDSPVQREAYRKLLEADYSLRFFTNGESLLEHLRDEQPALLLIDINMPGLSGLDTLIEMKARGIDIPLTMVISTEQSKDLIIRSMLVGAKEYLIKPYRRDDLLERVHALTRLGLNDA